MATFSALGSAPLFATQRPRLLRSGLIDSVYDARSECAFQSRSSFSPWACWSDTPKLIVDTTHLCPKARCAPGSGNAELKQIRTVCCVAVFFPPIGIFSSEVVSSLTQKSSPVTALSSKCWLFSPNSVCLHAASSRNVDTCSWWHLSDSQGHHTLGLLTAHLCAHNTMKVSIWLVACQRREFQSFITQITIL